jgi:hypothetical protein
MGQTLPPSRKSAHQFRGCAYCGRLYAADEATCHGCGAPRTAEGPPGEGSSDEYLAWHEEIMERVRRGWVSREEAARVFYGVRTFNN